MPKQMILTSKLLVEIHNTQEKSALETLILSISIQTPQMKCQYLTPSCFSIRSASWEPLP